MDYVKYMSIIYRKMQIYLTHRLSEFSIGSGQHMYIICICEHSGESQNKLAERLAMDKSTVAKMLMVLEKEGFLTRNVSDDDKRSFDIFPTEKAQAIYPQICKIKQDWQDVMTNNLTDVERIVFEQLLQKVMGNIVENID